MKHLVWVAAALLFVSADAAQAQEKRYNFSAKPSIDAPAQSEIKSETKPEAAPVAQVEKEAPAAPEVKADEVKAESAPPAPAPIEAAAAPQAPVKKHRKAKKADSYVYSPSKDAALPSDKMAQDKAEKLVRFFIGSCLKFYGRNAEMVKYMDAHFPRLETERKADFAPIISGNINTQYWDVVKDDMFYMLAKDTSGGKCDVIAKEGASTAIHTELKAVMDGLTITKILQTKTEYEKIDDQNKEVTIVNILGHPLEKELGIVATTKIREDGDNVASILTMFTVPQETVEIK